MIDAIPHIYRTEFFNGKWPEKIIMFEDDLDQSVWELNLPEPPNLNEIDGFNRPVSEQKFIREPLPKLYHHLINEVKHINKGMVDLNTINKLILHTKRQKYKDLHQYIMKMWDRRLNGYWFMNHGVPTYITGKNEMYCRWWHLDFGLPDYKDRDRLFWLVWDDIEEDLDSLGGIYMKHRREGATSRAGFILYEYVSRQFEKFAGIQSKNDRDAKKVFTKQIVSPWKKLPFFYQPIYDGTTNPKSELLLKEPARRSSGGLIDISKEDTLDGWIDYRPTLTDSYDSQKLHRFLLDESGKMKDISVVDLWSIAKTCLTTGASGKCISTSTVAEMTKGGGENFKILWKGSDRANKDLNDQTATGLYRFFFSAIMGLETEKKKFYDEYGNSLWEEADEWIENRRKNLKKENPVLLNEFIRQYPKTVREAFRSGLSKGYFASEILNQRLEHYTFPENLDTVKGNFVPVETEDSPFRTTDFRYRELHGKPIKIIFEPSEKGRYEVSWRFSNLNESNAYYMRHGMIMPGNSMRFIGGTDPIKYDDDEVKGYIKSKASGAIFMEFDSSVDDETAPPDEWETERFVCDYIHRPDTTDEYGWDMAYMFIYYGCENNVETNINVLRKFFKDHNLRGYLFHHFNDDKMQFDKIAGEDTNLRSKGDLFAAVGNYIKVHGIKEKHHRIMEQWNEVTYENVGKYDLFIASAKALTASRSRRPLMEEMQRQREKNELQYSEHELPWEEYEY